MDVLRVKIISDGTPQGTKIVEAETGKELGRVHNIKLTGDVAQKRLLAILGVYVESAEVEADALLRTLCPSCGHVVYFPNHNTLLHDSTLHVPESIERRLWGQE